MARSSSNRLSSFSTPLDDLIGTESGVFLSSDEDTITREIKKTKTHNGAILERKLSFKPKKEYPPPLPFMAQTGHLPRCMPRKLVKNYSNGRLRIKAEMVKKYEYFEEYRADGRLVLNLVSLKDEEKDNVESMGVDDHGVDAHGGQGRLEDQGRDQAKEAGFNNEEDGDDDDDHLKENDSGNNVDNNNKVENQSGKELDIVQKESTKKLGLPSLEFMPGQQGH